MITEATQQRFAALAERLAGDEHGGGRGGRWLVLTHDNPDPDALASAILPLTTWAGRPVRVYEVDIKGPPSGAAPPGPFL